MIMGITIFRYFMTRYLVTATWFLAGILSLIFITDFNQINARFSGIASYSITTGVTIAALRVLIIFQQAMPFIGLFASMAVLIQLNRKYELVIVRSAGQSVWQFLTPLCVGAFVFGVFAILVINPIASRSFALGEEYQADLMSRSTGASSALSTPWIRQFGAQGDVIIGAKSVLSDGLVLISPVFILLDTNGVIKERIDGTKATLGDKQWVVSGATVSKHGAVARKFDTTSVPTTLTAQLVRERLLSPEMIPLLELPKAIAIAKSLGYPSDRFAMQFHSLMALPALLVVMTLIAATVTLNFVRFGQSAKMILGGVLAGFMLYVVSVLVKAFGGAGIVPPIMAAWLPVVLAFLFGVSFLLHKEDG